MLTGLPTLADIVEQNHRVLRACKNLQYISDRDVLDILEPIRTEMTKLSLMIELVDRTSPPAE